MIKKLLGFTEKMFRKKVTNINLNQMNYLGRTSLHWASLNGHQSVVELLLDRGSDIDQKDGFNGEFILSIFIWCIIYPCINHSINLPIC